MSLLHSESNYHYNSQGCSENKWAKVSGVQTLWKWRESFSHLPTQCTSCFPLKLFNKWIVFDLVLPVWFSAFWFVGASSSKRWQIRLTTAETCTLNADRRVMFAQRPLQHCRGTKNKCRQNCADFMPPYKSSSGIWGY